MEFCLEIGGNKSISRVRDDEKIISVDCQFHGC